MDTLRKPKIIFKPYRKGEMKKTFGNNQLVKKIIKFKKFTNIDSGIKKTINYLVESFEKMGCFSFVVCQ